MWKNAFLCVLPARILVKPPKNNALDLTRVCAERLDGGVTQLAAGVGRNYAGAVEFCAPTRSVDVMAVSTIESLAVGHLYSNEDIFRSLRVSNAGGIRLHLRDATVARAVVMTAVQGVHTVGENPFQDRLEKGILTYTAAARVGEQTLAGPNKRLIEQKG